MVIAHGQGDHIRRDAEPRGREQVALNDLAKRGIGGGGAKCRSYAVEASVRGIFARTGEITADRGGEAVAAGSTKSTDEQATASHPRSVSYCGDSRQISARFRFGS